MIFKTFFISLKDNKVCKNKIVFQSDFELENRINYQAVFIFENLS